MNSKFLLIVLSLAGFTSCNTVYKTGQTPDDVYYSPVRGIDIAGHSDTSQSNVYTNSGYSYYDAQTDRKWRRYQNYNYTYSNFDPCYPGYVDPKLLVAKKYNAPRKIIVSSYNHNQNSTQQKVSKTSSGTGVGNFLREVFSGGSSSSTSENINRVNSSGGSSATSKPTTTSAPVRTFRNK